jgi:hypothetical protein
MTNKIRLLRNDYLSNLPTNQLKNVDNIKLLSKGFTTGFQKAIEWYDFKTQKPLVTNVPLLIKVLNFDNEFIYEVVTFIESKDRLITYNGEYITDCLWRYIEFEHNMFI